MDWFSREILQESHIFFMGKSMVSGEDFPQQTNPFVVRFRRFRRRGNFDILKTGPMRSAGNPLSSHQWSLLGAPHLH